MQLQIAGNFLNNEKLTFNGSKWTAAHQLYWSSKPCDFYAIYPYQDLVSVEEHPFKVATDQNAIVSEYEIADEGGITELRLYREVFRGGEVVLELEKSAAYVPAVFIELMNRCRVMRWDGFHGAHPKNVSDGIMFDFMAVVNGGQKIRADGSENFPQGYREFVRELNRMLAECGNRRDRGDCDGS